jgi:hypothetical protein
LKSKEDAVVRRYRRRIVMGEMEERGSFHVRQGGPQLTAPVGKASADPRAH